MKKAGLILIAALILMCLMTGLAVAAGVPADGAYTVEATLSGGSGRASVESPSQMTVTDGAATAIIIWSSPYYEYMTVGGETYYPISDDGNSTFEIPVTLDEALPVSALTVAMSEPHEIDYTLYFDSATIRSADGGTPVVWYVAAAAAAVVVVILAVLIAKKAAARRTESKDTE